MSGASVRRVLQEREVRLTVQRLLAAHLVPQVVHEHKTYDLPTYWPFIDLVCLVYTFARAETDGRVDSTTVGLTRQLGIAQPDGLVGIHVLEIWDFPTGAPGNWTTSPRTRWNAWRSWRSSITAPVTRASTRPGP